MAKGLLGLEISPKELRYVYLQRQGRRYILFKNGKLSLEDSPAIRGPTNLTQAIQGILAKESISPAKICLTFSGDDLLIHQINLPKMPENELKEVIRSEIERAPKFYNKEFDYIYSAHKLNEQKLRVLVCAISKDSLNSYLQGIRRAGIPLESLEISPLNLLEIIPQWRVIKDKERAEALLVLNHRSSCIMILWQNDCKLFFQMATGKSDLYPADAKLNNSVFLSWTEEIKRVFRSYQREFGGREVERLWFIWDNDNSQDLGELVGKKLETEVTMPKLENFDILQGDKKTAFNPIFFLPLAGPFAYIKGLKQKFDFKHFLLPITLKKAIRKAAVRASIYILLISLLSGRAAINFISGRDKLLINEKGALERIALLEKQTAEMKKERDHYLNIKDRLLMQAAVVRMLNRVSWSEIFARVSEALPGNVSLNSFNVSESGEVKIEGATFSIDLVSEMIRKINTASFLEDIQFDFLKERKIEDKKIVEFGLITKLREGLNER